MISTRRDFIKTFSTLAASGVISSNLPWLKNLSAQENNTPVKLGIIGIGSRGTYLTNILLQIPGVEISCFCDDYEANYESARQLIGPHARGYYDYREMLDREELDGVVVATPLYEHARISIDVLDAGIHLFVEKALAKTIEECNDIVLAQQRNGKILQVGHQRIFSPLFLQGIKRIREGEIGKVTQMRGYWHRNSDWRRPVPSPELERKINWRLYREYSCGLMTELASHHLQVANWVMDAPPEYVWGSGSINYWNDGREVYDNISAIYRYPGGTHLVYDSMTSNRKYGLEIEVMGPMGTLEMQAGKIYEEFPDPAPGILQLINQIEKEIFDVVPIGGASWVPEDPSDSKGKYLLDKVLKSDGSEMQMEAFVSDIRNNRVDPWLIKQGFYSGIATIMGYEAILKNEVVYWPAGLAI